MTAVQQDQKLARDLRNAAIVYDLPFIIEPKVSRPAYLSFTLSIVAIGLWVNQGTPAPLVAVLAIAFGVWGRVAIRRSQGRLSGRFFASSGLWSGILHLILIVPYVALGNAGFA